VLKNPEEYCLVCSHRYGFSEESCPNCGFDPVGNKADADAYIKALYDYSKENPEEAPF